MAMKRLFFKKPKLCTQNSQESLKELNLNWEIKGRDLKLLVIIPFVKHNTNFTHVSSFKTSTKILVGTMEKVIEVLDTSLTIHLQRTKNLALTFVKSWVPKRNLHARTHVNMKIITKCKENVNWKDYKPKVVQV